MQLRTASHTNVSQTCLTTVPHNNVSMWQVGEVERLVSKLQQLRQDADQAEERATQVTEEAKELVQVQPPAPPPLTPSAAPSLQAPSWDLIPQLDFFTSV